MSTPVIDGYDASTVWTGCDGSAPVDDACGSLSATGYYGLVVGEGDYSSTNLASQFFVVSDSAEAGTVELVFTIDSNEYTITVTIVAEEDIEEALEEEEEDDAADEEESSEAVIIEESSTELDNGFSYQLAKLTVYIFIIGGVICGSMAVISIYSFIP